MTPNEYGYWYLGKPAVEEINDPYGAGIAKPGSVRDGGLPFIERFTDILLLEHGDGREPIYDPALERVQVGLKAWRLRWRLGGTT